MSIHLGIDIGAISVKMVAVGEETNRERFEECTAENDAFFHTDGDDASLLAGRPLLISKYRRAEEPRYRRLRTFWMN